MAMVLGFHLYDTVEEAREYPFSMCAVPFTKDDREAPAQAETLLAKGVPAAVITNEAVTELALVAGDAVSVLFKASHVILGA